MSTVSGGFFTHRSPAQHEIKKGTDHGVIHVGGEQFHAAAVVLIDYVQAGSSVNDETVKKILERYNQYFPKSITAEPYLRSKERMAILFRPKGKAEIVERLAYVLRQLAIDEVYAKPTSLDYRDIFAGLSSQTSKGYLRNPHVTLPRSALNALAEALNIPIILSFKEPGKLLRKQERCIDAQQEGLMIQVQQGQYLPQVKNKANFASVGKLAVSAKPVEIPAEQEGTLADALQLVDVDNEHILRTYKQHRTTLFSMVTTGEGSHPKLMSFYKGLNLSLSQIKKASFITELDQAKYLVIVEDHINLAQEKVELLVNRVAALIGTGVINADDLYEQIEMTHTRNRLVT